MNDLEKFFSQSCELFKGSVAEQYTIERKIPDNIALGYATQELLNSFRRSSELSEKKLLVQWNSRYIFSDRLVFAIHDERHKLVSIAGRTIVDMLPKYYNTVYSKNFYLYGLNLTKQWIIERNCVVVVEGYLDWLRLYSVGIPSVALLSTSLSQFQLIKLLRYCNRIVLCLDLDKAGQRAVKRIRETYGQYNIQLDNIELEDDQDPDSYVLKYGAEQFCSLSTISF